MSKSTKALVAVLFGLLLLVYAPSVSAHDDGCQHHCHSSTTTPDSIPTTDDTTPHSVPDSIPTTDDPNATTSIPDSVPATPEPTNPSTTGSVPVSIPTTDDPNATTSVPDSIPTTDATTSTFVSDGQLPRTGVSTDLVYLAIIVLGIGGFALLVRRPRHW